MLTVCTYWSTHGSCFLLWPDPLVKPHLGQRRLHSTLHHALKSAADQRILLIAVEQNRSGIFCTELTTGLRLGKICGHPFSAKGICGLDFPDYTLPIRSKKQLSSLLEQAEEGDAIITLRASKSFAPSVCGW